MRNLFVLALLSMTVFGCVSAPVKEQWANKYVNKTGYILLPVSPKSKSGRPFSACEQTKITQVKALGNTISLIAEQSGELYEVEGHSKDGRFLYSPQTQTVSILDEFFKERLPADRTIVLKEGKRSSRKLICEGRVWTGMKEDEFLFVKGAPDKVNTTVSAGGTLHQYVYRQGGPTSLEAEYYYLRDGVLTSWQN